MGLFEEKLVALEVKQMDDGRVEACLVLVNLIDAVNRDRVSSPDVLRERLTGVIAKRRAFAGPGRAVAVKPVEVFQHAVARRRPREDIETIAAAATNHESMVVGIDMLDTSHHRQRLSEVSHGTLRSGQWQHGKGPAAFLQPDSPSCL